MKLKYKDSKLTQVQADFRNYYNTKLKNDYVKLEGERGKYLKKFYLYLALSVVIIGSYAWIDRTGVMTMREGDIKILMTLIVVAFVVCWLPISSYKSKTKMMVMPKILAFWKNFSLHKTGLKVTKEIIEKSELFGNFNETETDDNFSGTYQGVDVCVSEQKVIYSGRKMSHTHFKGVFILLRFNKKLQRKTIVRSKDFTIPGGIISNFYFLILLLIPLVIAAPFLLDCLRGKGDIGFPSMFVMLLCSFLPSLIYIAVLYFALYHRRSKDKNKNGGKLSEVVLEDPLFRKKWDVVSSDQIEARVVLTPRFMERIKAVKTYFHGNRIDCSFFDDKILLAVYTTKDMFETTSLFLSSLKYHKVYEVVTQMYSVFSVISEINGKKFDDPA